MEIYSPDLSGEDVNKLREEENFWTRIHGEVRKEQ